MTSLLLSLLLTQADVPAVASTPSPADRAAAAAEKAADAAARAADAAQRIADKVAPKAPADVPGAAAPAAPSSWIVNFGLGLSLLGGNTESATLTGNAAIDKKWDLWSIGIRFNGALGFATPPGAMPSGNPSTVARRAALTARGDRGFGGFVSAFVLAGGEFDHVKNIESRVYGEAGASFSIFNEKEGDLEKLFLKLDLALRGGRETRFTYFPTPAAVTPYEIPLLSPRVALMGRWALNKSFRVSEEFEVLPYLLAPVTGRFLINSHTKLNARVTDVASISLGFLLSIDTTPPNPMLRPYDYTLTAGADFVF